MPKVTQKPSAKKRGRPPNIPPPYPPPPPPPPPPVNNPYYQKFFEEYWKKYATGYQATPGIPPPPPAGAPFAKLPAMVVPALPPMALKVPPPPTPKAPATRSPNGLHNEEYPINNDRKTFVLARPNDAEYLSEKQCYVRTRLTEIFIAEETDVTKSVRGRRASFAGQVGMRCVFCVPALDPKHRIERAICYPTTTAKFYQTVQDMQHFHFNSCPAIPRGVKEMYQSLKGNMNNRRGTQAQDGETRKKISPREFWAKCCEDLGIVDHIGDDGGNAGVKLKKDGEHGLVERAKLKKDGYAKELFMPPKEVEGESTKDGEKEEEGAAKAEDTMEVEEVEGKTEEGDEEDKEMETVLAEEVTKEGDNSGGFDDLVADLDNDGGNNGDGAGDNEEEEEEDEKVGEEEEGKEEEEGEGDDAEAQYAQDGDGEDC